MTAPASCSIVCYRSRREQVERLLASVTTARPDLLVYLVDNSIEMVAAFEEALRNAQQGL